MKPTQPAKVDQRTYHNTDSAYSLPNDNDEHRRLEVQAERLRELMNNKVIHAPLDVSSARKMMDIGCGTGIMTHEMATAFPHAQVYGLDLSPVPNVREKLPNIEYVQGNVMELSDSKTRDPRFENGSFDFIFSRLLIAGMTDWKGYVERCVTLTRPDVSSTDSATVQETTAHILA
jgi:2-polyprenyl-3-methyl-5-hydroxy-6-metoxy-1,4-benzoquinol methylase